MKAKTLFVVFSALLLLAACAPKAVPKAPEAVPAPKVEQKPPAAAPPAAAPPAAAPEVAVSEIESSSMDVDSLQEEFDLSVLDQLEADLAEIDNIDLG